MLCCVSIADLEGTFIHGSVFFQPGGWLRYHKWDGIAYPVFGVLHNKAKPIYATYFIVCGHPARTQFTPGNFVFVDSLTYISYFLHVSSWLKIIQYSVVLPCNAYRVSGHIKLPADSRLARLMIRYSLKSTKMATTAAIVGATGMAVSSKMARRKKRRSHGGSRGPS